MISIKDGVNISGIRPEMSVALQIVAYVLTTNGYSTIVTSVMDGKHGRGSLHYVGCAMDIRTRHIPEGQQDALVLVMRESLGAQFDVVLEDTHIHIEFQPK